MRIIKKAAFFALCKKCRKHGIITFSDGGKTGNIYSVERGVKTLEECFGIGQVTREEILHVTSQLENAGIADLEGLIDAISDVVDETYASRSVSLDIPPDFCRPNGARLN